MSVIEIALLSVIKTGFLTSSSYPDPEELSLIDTPRVKEWLP